MKKLWPWLKDENNNLAASVVIQVATMAIAFYFGVVGLNGTLNSM
jgi:hypothetical protein